MEATVHLPEALARRLERLAVAEGASLGVLIERLVSEHAEGHAARPLRRGTDCGKQRKDVRFPLISKEKTGVILPVTGADLDEMFALEDLAS